MLTILFWTWLALLIVPMVLVLLKKISVRTFLTVETVLILPILLALLLLALLAKSGRIKVRNTGLYVPRISRDGVEFITGKRRGRWL